MAAAGRRARQDTEPAAGEDPPRRQPPSSWTTRRRSSSAPTAPSPPSRAIAVFPGSVCTSPQTRWWSTAFPARTGSPGANIPVRGRWAWCSERLGRRRRPHVSRGHASRRSPTDCSWRPRAACSSAVEQCRVGNRLGGTSRTRCRRTSRGRGFSIVRSLVGHGIGRDMHEDPADPQLRRNRARVRSSRRAWSWRSNRWVTAGRHAVRMGDDHWAIFSQGWLAGGPFQSSPSPSRPMGPPRPHSVAQPTASARRP